MPFCGKRQKSTSAAANLISSHRNVHRLLRGRKVDQGEEGGAPRLTGKGVEPERTRIRWEIQFLRNILKLEVRLIGALIAALSTCPRFTVGPSRCGLDGAGGQRARGGSDVRIFPHPSAASFSMPVESVVKKNIE